MPQSPSPQGAPPWRSGLSILEVELFSETASTLGRLGRRVEETLAALADPSLDPAGAERAIRLKSAVQAVWYYFIQREMCGMRDHRETIAVYGIPREVIARLGTTL